MIMLANIVNSNDLNLQLEDRNLRIFDCTVKQITRIGQASVIESCYEDYIKNHIPNSRYLHMVEDLVDLEGAHPYSLPKVENLMNLLRREDIDNNSKIILYSNNSPKFATRVWWILTVFGLTDIKILNGGLPAWILSGFKPSLDYVSRDASNFRPLINNEIVASKLDVISALNSNDVLLINTLDVDLFIGNSERHFGRPGRIPHSINLPYTSLFDKYSFTFHGKDILYNILKDRGIFNSRNIIVYCGGGISATVLAFVLSGFNVPNVKLYHGSLLEWSKDITLPMITGSV